MKKIKDGKQIIFAPISVGELVDKITILEIKKEKVEGLFKFCGLEFNDECFKFQKNYQFINNASNIQIRNNLEKYDNKYENYFDIICKF